MNCRAASVDVEIRQRHFYDGIVIVVDSTGLKVYGEGEWKVRKHGISK